jgi:hypothetical protein
MTPATATDLTPLLFVVLRDAFFDNGPTPKAFTLRNKMNTQDDPLDEHIHKLLTADPRLAGETHCSKAPGPLITPDMVILRSALCEGVLRTSLRSDLTRIVGLEVKKLERQAGGAVARSSGLDYNTTPPCGTVRVYDRNSKALDIRGFYLFVCQEAVPGPPAQCRLTALVLCDGDLLNADFEFYLSIVGLRTKQIELGTYRDGANRSRPMLIFANPLGVSPLDHQATLIHPRPDLEEQFPGLRLAGRIRRTTHEGGLATFYGYRMQADLAAGQAPFDLTDPFPTPVRTEATRGRGRFRIAIEPAD